MHVHHAENLTANEMESLRFSNVSKNYFGNYDGFMFRVKSWRRRHMRRGLERKYRKAYLQLQRQANPGWEAQIVFYTSLSGKAKQLPVIEFDCFKINLLLPKEANFLVAYSTTLVIPPSGQLNMGPGLFLP